MGFYSVTPVAFVQCAMIGDKLKYVTQFVPKMRPVYQFPISVEKSTSVLNGMKQE